MLLQLYPGFTVYHGIKVDGHHTTYICILLVLVKKNLHAKPSDWTQHAQMHVNVYKMCYGNNTHPDCV